MARKQSDSSLSLVNYITGISDGLLLPIIPCGVITLLLAENTWQAVTLFTIVACFGSLIYGAARYFGEKNEILHNHPALSKQELAKDEARLKHIGIDPQLAAEMIVQMEEEQNNWLEEVRENDMPWESLDLKRAVKSGLQTGLGFLFGGYLIALPFGLLLLGEHLIPYFLFAEFFILFLFGWMKGKCVGKHPLILAVVQVLQGSLILAILILAILWTTAIYD